MPITHIFFIPILFFLGLLVGAQAVRFRHAAVVVDPLHRRRRRQLFAAVALFLAIFAATHVFQFGGAAALEAQLHGSPLFDKFPSFEPEQVLARMNALGQAGRAAYQRFTYTADLVFPISLLLVLLATARFVAAHTAPAAWAQRLLAVIPSLWFVSDLVENILIYQLLAQFPEQSRSMALALPVVTMTKFGLLAASIALPGVWLAFTSPGSKAGRRFAEPDGPRPPR